METSNRETSNNEWSYKFVAFSRIKSPYNASELLGQLPVEKNPVRLSARLERRVLCFHLAPLS